MRVFDRRIPRCSVWAWLLLFGLGSACGDDQSDDTEVGNVDSDGTGDGDPGDGDGDASGDGDGDGDTGDGDGEAGDGDGDSACPAAAEDDACTACVKESCCVQLLACEADEDCACLRDCVVTEADLPQCNADCGVVGVNQPFVQLSGCSSAQCAAECG